LAKDLEQAGQSLFFPPNVKGWDGGREWINSSTLLARANNVHRVLHDANTRFAGGTLAELIEAAGARTPESIVTWLEGLLLAVPLQPGVKQHLIDLATAGTQSKGIRWIELVHVICTLPEFQIA
jgi:uncharacterized protein (DUF1800 family)